MPSKNEKITYKHWLLFTATLLSSCLISMTSSAMMNVMGLIKNELGMGLVTTEWLVTGFAAISCGLICICGQLGDVFGHAKMLMLGLILSVIGNFLFCLGFDVSLVMIGSVFRGMGAACIIPCSISTIRTSFPPEKLMSVISWWSVLTFSGFAFGPLFAGLGAMANWRIIFWVAFGLFIFAALALHVTRDLHPKLAQKNKKVDWLGTLLLSSSLIIFVILISEGAFWGWSSAPMIVLYSVCPVLFILFLISQNYVKNPIVIYSQIKDYHFLSGMVLAFVTLFVFYPILYFYTVYAESPTGLNFKPYLAGATIVPVGFWIVFLAYHTKKIVSILGITWMCILGCAFMLTGMLIFMWMGPNPSYSDIWWRLCIVGIGIGLTFPIVSALALGRINPKFAGMASGLIATMYYLGATLGVTLCSVWYMAYARSHIKTGLDKFNLSKGQVFQLVDTAHTSFNKLNMVLAQYSPYLQDKIRTTLESATSGGFGRAGLLAAILAGVGLLVSLGLLYNKKEK